MFSPKTTLECAELLSSRAPGFSDFKYNGVKLFSVLDPLCSRGHYELLMVGGAHMELGESCTNKGTIKYRI